MNYDFLYFRFNFFSFDVVIISISGILSVTIRQTNIVWFCCFAFLKCCKVVDDEASKAGRKLSRAQKRQVSYVWVSRFSLNLMN